ncbi:MAG: G-D-S-L family lipolytic protein, partial [Ignavibacteria bacterium]|nr:G-D-S-L family lipolytic protein [Ignavibacteria bacterium]
MKMKIKILSVILLTTFIVIGCNDFNEIDAPIQNGTSGTANFSRFVSLGNSITAGYQSGTIYQSG